MSSLERLLAESRSRTHSYVAAAKAAMESTGEGAMLSQIASMGGGFGSLTRQSQMYHAAEQYRHNIGTVFSSIRPIRQCIAGQPLRVARCCPKNKKTINYARKALLPQHLKSYSEELEVLETHPLLDCMKDPNPVMVQYQLIDSMVASLEITGRGYLWGYDDKNQKSKKPKKQLWPMPTSWIEDKHEPGKLFVYYRARVENATEPVDIPPEQIARMAYIDPANPLGSLSPLQAQARAITSDEAIAESQRRSFSNGAFPGLAFIAGKHPDLSGAPGYRPVLTKEQREQILTAIRQRYRGVQHTDDPIILDGVIEDVKMITNRPRDMDYLNSMGITKIRIEQGHGVNPIINGEVLNANRATATAADDLFNEFTINPKIALLSQCWTKYVLPMFDDSDDVVAYFEERKATNPDEKRAQQMLLYDRAAMSINDMRQDAGLPPIHGGDVAYVQQGLTPVHVVRADQPKPKPEDLPGYDASQQGIAGDKPAESNGKPSNEDNKPSANGNGKPADGGANGAATQEKPDKAALAKLARALLRSRGIGVRIGR